MKAAAKRTAFGDLGNAANISRPSKDDMAIPPKGFLAAVEKPVTTTTQDKRSAALLRPAQRPLSVSGLKSLLHNASGVNSQASAKQPLQTSHSIQTAVQQVNVKKLATKRSTAVFKDTTISQPDQSNLSVTDNLLPIAPIPPAHHQLPSIQHRQLEQLPEEHSKSNDSPSEALEPSKPKDSIEEPFELLRSSEGAAPLRSDGIYIDDHGEVRQYIFQDDNEATEDKGGVLVEEHATSAKIPRQPSPKVPVQSSDKQRNQNLKENVAEHKLAPASEPEEYWDEEEGNYEEEEYVTARSFKSRGENTTNGATTVLFPKVNQKIKKEFAAAKQLIESTRTAEEIDDETWDTSMVAEYGEEIFGYMRDLEVRDVSILCCTRLTKSNRSRCCQTLTTWIIKPKYNGRCGPC